MILPKGFEDQSSWDSFLLSEERFNIYKEVDDFIHGNSIIDQSAGFVPSGPHGMGKSGIGLLVSLIFFYRREYYILGLILICCVMNELQRIIDILQM